MADQPSQLPHEHNDRCFPFASVGFGSLNAEQTPHETPEQHQQRLDKMAFEYLADRKRVLALINADTASCRTDLEAAGFTSVVAEQMALSLWQQAVNTLTGRCKI
jgi:hypothetical protein